MAGDLRKARLFSNTFYFIENSCTINNHLEFDRSFRDIYPSGLQLNKGSIIYWTFVL